MCSRNQHEPANLRTMAFEENQNQYRDQWMAFRHIKRLLDHGRAFVPHRKSLGFIADKLGISKWEAWRIYWAARRNGGLTIA